MSLHAQRSAAQGDRCYLPVQGWLLIESDLHIEAAGEACDRTPLFAAYWSEVPTAEITT